MKWILAFLIISLLILFHEFGHFLAAKLNGVTVEEFSLGFGPRLLSAVIGDTRYSIKLLFFGGSCRMKGMYAELMDDDEEEGGQPLPARSAPEPGSFLAASVGKRAVIIFMGPFFNFILAFVCSVLVLSVVGYDPAVVTYVAEGSAAEAAGLIRGDEITSFQGERTVIGRDVDSWFLYNDLKAGEAVSLTVQRDGEEVAVSFVPETIRRYLLGLTYLPDSDRAEVDSVSVNSPLDQAGVRAGDVITAIDGEEITDGKSLSAYFEEHPLDGRELVLSIERGSRSYEKRVTPVYTDYVQTGFGYNLGRMKTTPAGVVRYSFTELRYWIESTVKGLVSLFTGRFSPKELSGPVGIADIVGTTYEESRPLGPVMTLMNMLYLIILLSANLGVMNLLPLPVLDGGRLVLLLVEAVRGKRLKESVEAALQTVMLLLFVILMVYVMYNDITRVMFG